jgi:hypothetical protein
VVTSILTRKPGNSWRFYKPNAKLLAVTPVSAERKGVTVASAWWKAFSTSPPLDVEAGLRFKKREGRLLDVVFIGACELAGIPTTSRQARKWNNNKGLALRFRNKAKELL